MSVLKKLTPSQSLVKQSLRGHAWVGLFWAALLYLICLSGALVVFYPEMERWEQPMKSEYQQISDQAINSALHQVQADSPHVLESLYFIYPNQDLPRAHVSAVYQDKSIEADSEWWVDESGQVAEAVSAPWTEMMTDLHIYLHLPHTLGIIMVGMLGAMMCGLLISGVLAQPNLFKDAFKLRLGSNRHLEQTDIHNRLSVWSLPFFFVVSLTGAYIGLFGVSLVVVDWFEKDHDSDQIISEVFGGDPKVQEPVVPVDLAAISTDLKQRAPGAEPIYLVIQKPQTEGQYVEVAATLPQRLIYSEIYRYHSDGRFIDYQHLSDGDLGRQVAYSSYRVHFGHFGGFATKILYLVLGLAMAVITVTGVNMWFEKRKLNNRWYTLWRGFVWSTPLSMAISACLALLFALNPVWVFWSALVLFSLLTLGTHKQAEGLMAQRAWIVYLKLASLVVLVLTVVGHSLNHDLAPTEHGWYWLFGLGAVLLAVMPLINFRRMWRPAVKPVTEEPL